MVPNNIPLKLNSKFIILLAMIYTTASIAADAVAFKFTYFFGLVESGATLLFPLTYILGDVISEVYGWNTAMKIVWFGLACEALFAIMITWVIHLPIYGIGQFQNEYMDILGNIWLFVLAGIISNAVAGLLNVFFISKWKIMMHGRLFWVRSIISTCISEFILIFLTVLIAFVPFIHFKATMKVFADAYLLEIIYAMIFVLPAQLFVMILKRADGIDAYDYGVSYNPFKLVLN
ncbi:MAG: queuosine precursor transporter [Proteobacteria bacterium]|nr:queuosine precursor transporter [Pseudomonadota bacterium]